METILEDEDFVDRLSVISMNGADSESFKEKPIHRFSSLSKIGSATFGAILTSLTVTPFDVVKTRMQSLEVIKEHVNLKHVKFHRTRLSLNETTEPVVFKGTWDGLKHISSREGVPALWRGLVPTLIMAVPSTVIYYTTYESLRDLIISLQAKPNSLSPNSHQSEPQSYHSQATKHIPFTSSTIYAPLLAGSISRAGATFCISPLELLRTRMQSGDEASRTLRDAVRGIRTMVSKHGLHSLWRGLGSTLWRDVPFSAIYWVSFETLKKTISARTVHKQKDPWSLFFIDFAAGASAGTIAAALTTPFDVAKTVQQVSSGQEITLNGKKSGMLKIMKDIYVREGIRGLFKGLSPRIAKVSPACAIMISSYEAGKRLF